MDLMITKVKRVKSEFKIRVQFQEELTAMFIGLPVWLRMNE